jgi:hypothetical protein
LGADATYNFTFEFDGADEASARALTSLYRWLREDSAVRVDADVELVNEAEPEHMGAADALCAVLSQLTSVGSLAVAFAAWRDSRSATPPVRIRFREVSIDVGDATAEQLAVALSAAASAHADSPSSDSSSRPEA